MSLEEFNTRADYKYLGGDTIFSVPFSYINKSHVIVVVNGDTENPITDFTWLSENEIRINSEINTGDVVSIQRHTPIDDKMVQFTNGNILDEYTQNLSQDQLFNIVQEVKDGQDDLNADMQEFVNIKDAVNDQMQLITEAGEKAEIAVELCQDTQELVNNIGTTFNELQEQVRDGVPTRVTDNLFTIKVYDKTLTDGELVGLAEQGSTVSAKDYPNAYLELAKEYDEGETKIFTSSDAVSYVNAYQGEVTGNFYTSIDKPLANGVTVYSDNTLNSSLGTVEVYTEVNADKYKGSITDTLFIASNAEIEKATHVYSDKTLLNLVGTIEDVKQADANKYTAEVSGDFYVSPDALFKRGQKVYSDATLTKEKGEITYLGTISVDRYVLNDNMEFYVPKDTVLTQGVEIFSDKTLTTSLGEITVKGTTISSSWYYYKLSSATIGDSNSKTRYGYSKVDLSKYANTEWLTKLESGKIFPLYSDKECTKPLYSDYYKLYLCGAYVKGSSGLANSASVDGFILVGYKHKNYTSPVCNLLNILNARSTINNSCQLVNTSGTTSSPYICLNHEPTKYAYKKVETVDDIKVISINNENYEPYTLIGKDENEYVKITGTDYQLLVKETTHQSMVIKISNHDPEEVNSLGLDSSNGVVLEYNEYSNGHKVVDSKYQSVILNLLTSEETSSFYIIDRYNETLTLPTLDKTKKVYFTVGNTLLIDSVINVITQEHLDRRLADYALMTDDTVHTLIQYVAESGATLAEVKELITEAEVIASDTLEEF